MSTVTLTIDGRSVEARKGQTLLEACDEAGVYVPRLCHAQGLRHHGSCRICTVLVSGRPMASCVQPVGEGMEVVTSNETLETHRRRLIEMLFVEGNHVCPVCEKSGRCELQALAYRYGIDAPTYDHLFPQRDVDGSHPEVFIDRNRCILCGRCVNASRDLDGKNVFAFVGRGAQRRVAVNARVRLADTDLADTDRAVAVCPVGAIIRKGRGFDVPIGSRPYDKVPIGASSGEPEGRRNTP